MVIPPRVASQLRAEAEKLGVPVEDIILEKLSAGIDPKEKAKEYILVSMNLLEQAKAELEKGDLRQASEKIWGAVALAIKAYAYNKDNTRLSSHGELWRYKDKIVDVFGQWVRDSWNAAVHMHINFYEGWATKEDVEDAMRKAEKLVEKIRSEIM